MAMKQAGGLIALVLAAMGSTADAKLAEPAIEILPAWNGVVVPGNTTELGIRVTARDDRRGSVRVRLPGMASHAEVQLPAGQPQMVWLPLRALFSGREVPIEIALRGDSETLVEKWSPTLITDTPLVVAAMDQAWPALGGTSASQRTVLYVSDRALPRTPQAYDTVDALIIDQASLARLDAQRLSAMFGFLGSCGRLIALGLTRDIAARLRAAAGCDQRFFSAIQHHEALPDAVDRALMNAPVPLPSVVQLRSLLDHSGAHRASLTVAVFLAAYLLFMIVVVRTVFPVWLVLLLPVVASLLVPLIWLGRAPGAASVIWMEMYGNDRVARTATLVQLHGNGRGMGTFSVPTAHGLPLPQMPGLRQPPQFEIGKDQLTVHVPMRLLTREELLFVGSTELVPPIRITFAAGGPRVHNTGGQPTGSGYLFWSGEQFDLPALAPGAQWSAEDSSPRRIATALGRWLGAHTRRGTASVMLRLPLPADGDPGPPAQADARWLFVRSIATHPPDAGGKT